MDTLGAYLMNVLRAPFDPAIRFALYYLAPTVAIAFVIWMVRDRSQPFWSWLLPRAVYRHRSTYVDVKLFLTNHILGVLGFFGALLFTPFIAYHALVTIATLAGGAYTPPPVTPTRALLLTLIVVVVSDFAKYWTHRIHHEWPSLWPFHAVHHSADVLTPVTVARVHPVEIIIRNILTSVMVGMAQGATLYALMGDVSLVAVGGANVFYVVFNALGSNLRHSHIWLSYGRVMEHILISPAQHQIHHSAAKKHFNKNYGSIFALWDWMFGSLYIPESYEDLTYGVADADGTMIEQPHPTLRAALLHPFVESWQAIRDRVAPVPQEQAPTHPQTPAE